MRAATGADLIARGVTTRQLWFWVEKGYIHPSNPNPGSGKTLWFTPAEAHIAEVMVQLCTAGVSASAAARIARDRELGAATLRRLADLVEAA